MSDKDVVAAVRDKFAALGPVMDERVRRVWAAAEARSLGRGRIAAVAEATGWSRTTIGAGGRDLRDRAAGVADPVPARRRTAAAGRGRPWGRTWSRWSSRRPGATRGRPCGGRARESGGWRRNWGGWATPCRTGP